MRCCVYLLANVSYVYLIFDYSANLKTAKEILSLSSPDLQRLANLSKSDVQHLHAVVAASFRKRPPTTGKHTYKCVTIRIHRHGDISCPFIS